MVFSGVGCSSGQFNNNHFHLGVSPHKKVQEKLINLAVVPKLKTNTNCSALKGFRFPLQWLLPSLFHLKALHICPTTRRNIFSVQHDSREAVSASLCKYRKCQTKQSMTLFSLYANLLSFSPHSYSLTLCPKIKCTGLYLILHLPLNTTLHRKK